MSGVQDILVGDSEVVLTGGTDNMSACPYAVRDIRCVNIICLKVLLIVQYSDILFYFLGSEPV